MTEPFSGVPKTPTVPSRGLSLFEKSIVAYVLRRGVEMSALKGWKTYLCMAVLIVAGGLKAAGYIDEGTYMIILSIVAPSGVMALRAGMNKLPAPPTP